MVTEMCFTHNILKKPKALLKNGDILSQNKTVEKLAAHLASVPNIAQNSSARSCKCIRMDLMLKTVNVLDLDAMKLFIQDFKIAILRGYTLLFTYCKSWEYFVSLGEFWEESLNILCIVVYLKVLSISPFKNTESVSIVSQVTHD